MVINEYIDRSRVPNRSYFSVSCDHCHVVFERQKRIYDKALYPDLCRSCKPHPKTGEIKSGESKYYCVDCNKQVYRTSVRCKPCHGKMRFARYDKFCRDCGVKIKYKSTVCLSCHNKNQNKNKSRERTKFNASKKWIRLRDFVFKRDDYTCDNCKKRGSYIECHHLYSYKMYPSKRLDPKNIITVCYSCHKNIHFGKDKKLKNKYIYDP